MAIYDTSVEEWNAATSSNAPSDSEKIGRDLAAQIRNIKSAYKSFSVNKAYELPDVVKSGVWFNTDGMEDPGFVVFQFQGNFTQNFQIGRKVIAHSPSSGALSGGVILVTQLSTTPSLVTQVTCSFFGNNWTTDQTSLYLGTDNVMPTSFPLGSMGGVFGFRGTSASVVVTFSTAVNTTKNPLSADANASAYTSGTKFYMPTKDYMVHASTCYKSASATEDSSVITKVEKDFNKFTAYIHTAPGVVDSVKMETYFDWYITMPGYCR